MSDAKLVVRCFMLSLDGFAAGVDQRMELPFGDYGEALGNWMFATRTFQEMIGGEGGEQNEDDDYVAHAFDGIGATIMGRNMFTVSRGPWPDDDWKGWWGPNPPYHSPTFVLTSHPRDPIPMEGGTTFHFASDGIEDALEKAFAAADGKDVRLMGGASTMQQYLAAGLVDEMHIALVPMFIGQGERVFPETSPPPGYTCVEHKATPAVMHLRFERS